MCAAAPSWLCSKGEDNNALEGEGAVSYQSRILASHRDSWVETEIKVPHRASGVKCTSIRTAQQTDVEQMKINDARDPVTQIFMPQIPKETLGIFCDMKLIKGTCFCQLTAFDCSSPALNGCLFCSLPRVQQLPLEELALA